MVRIDGRLSNEERASLPEIVCAALFDEEPSAPGSPYRDAKEAAPPARVVDEARAWEVLDEAASALPDDEAVMKAARAVARPEAREVIYAELVELAAVDGIDLREAKLLEWLRGQWGLAERPA
jgi:hypothetical protein